MRKTLSVLVYRDRPQLNHAAGVVPQPLCSVPVSFVGGEQVNVLLVLWLAEDGDVGVFAAYELCSYPLLSQGCEKMMTSQW